MKLDEQSRDQGSKMRFNGFGLSLLGEWFISVPGLATYNCCFSYLAVVGFLLNFSFMKLLMVYIYIDLA